MAYTEKRGKRWRVRWKLADGTYSGGVTYNEQTGIPFASEKEAKDYGLAQEALIKLGLRRDREHPPTFAEFAADWYAGLVLEPTSRRRYRVLLEGHLLHVFGDRPLAAEYWPPEEFDRWEQDMVRAGYAASTAAGVRGLLVNILNAAIPRYLDYNPAQRRRGTGRKGLRRLAAAREAAKVWPTPLQVVLLAERCALLAERCAAQAGRGVPPAWHEDVFTMMITKAWTGLRWSELLALSPDKLLPGALDIDQKLYEMGAFYLGHPKDGSVRRLDVPPFLEALLRELAGRARVCSCTGHPAVRRPIDGEELVEWCPGRRYLFLTMRGAHYQRGTFARQIMRPAADGMWPARTGRRARAARPVLADAAAYGPAPGRGRRRVVPGGQVWPARPLPLSWPMAVAGELFVPPRDRSRPNWDGWAEEERPHLVSWRPLVPGLTPHGLRHAHKTWMDEWRIHKALKVERMGHEDHSIQGVYGHVTDAMRREFLEVSQWSWENAIRERFEIHPHSPVAVLDAELAKWRSGKVTSMIVSQFSPRRRERAVSR